MPLEASVVILWIGLGLGMGMGMGMAFAEPTSSSPPPDAELIEFLGSFETKTGQWPDLNDALAKKPVVKTEPSPILAPDPAPSEEAK